MIARCVVLAAGASALMAPVAPARPATQLSAEVSSVECDSSVKYQNQPACEGRARVAPAKPWGPPNGANTHSDGSKRRRACGKRALAAGFHDVGEQRSAGPARQPPPRCGTHAYRETRRGESAPHTTRHPHRRSPAMPFLPRPQKLKGMVGDKGFDPLGFADSVGLVCVCVCVCLSVCHNVTVMLVYANTHERTTNTNRLRSCASIARPSSSTAAWPCSPPSGAHHYLHLCLSLSLSVCIHIDR